MAGRAHRQYLRLDRERMQQLWPVSDSIAGKDHDERSERPGICFPDHNNSFLPIFFYTIGKK